MAPPLDPADSILPTETGLASGEGDIPDASRPRPEASEPPIGPILGSKAVYQTHPAQSGVEGLGSRSKSHTEGKLAPGESKRDEESSHSSTRSNLTAARQALRAGHTVPQMRAAIERMVRKQSFATKEESDVPEGSDRLLPRVAEGDPTNLMKNPQSVADEPERYLHAQTAIRKGRLPKPKTAQN